jgi:hypothetical protein
VQHINAGRERGSATAPHSVVAYVICTTGPDAHGAALAELKHWGLDPAQPVTASGTAADIAHTVQAWVQAGADTIVLQPTPDTDIGSFAAFIGTEVQPLLNPTATQPQ